MTKDTSLHARRSREARRQAGNPRISGEGTPARAHPRAVPAAPRPRADSRRCEAMGPALGSTPRSVAGGGVTAQGYGAHSGLQGEGV